MSDEKSPVDWETWEPGMRATLMFIRVGDEVLLIEKQRGIGAGKINGPGGKIDPGETPLECAIRETQEELCVTATGVKKMGELFFAMSDMPDIHCHVLWRMVTKALLPRRQKPFRFGLMLIRFRMSGCGMMIAIGWVKCLRGRLFVGDSFSTRKPFSGEKWFLEWSGQGEIFGGRLIFPVDWRRFEGQEQGDQGRGNSVILFNFPRRFSRIERRFDSTENTSM